MNRSQQGFNLIELMIVVAIIGMLAALTLPSYQNHTAKTQFTEVLTRSNSIQSSLLEYYQINGVYPKPEDLEKETGYVANNDSKLMTKSFKSVAVARPAPEQASITFVFADEGVSKELRGKTVVFEGNENGIFTCRAEGIKPVILPAVCKGTPSVPNP